MTDSCRVSISAYDVHAADFAELAAAADECGFDTLWLGEHVVTPAGATEPHPTREGQPQHHSGPLVDPAVRLPDPMTTLAAAAARTRHISLATGVYLVPLRHPLATARIAATVQEIAGGRFLLGAGAGWLAAEFEALDIEFRGRFSRLEECLEIVRSASDGGWFSFAGQHFRFGPVQVSANPVRIPLVLGGNSGPALRRAARLADGWLSSGTLDYETAARLRDQLAAACTAEGRTTSLRCWFRIERPDPRLARRFAAEGMTDLVVWADQVWRGADKHARLAEVAGELGLVRYSQEQR
ncbi:TIGR03619 family F420-dependent LLM class oxidoreductase [Amycolatopsis acidicola]|uniref:TIGR03619 family F420-dependent LLM class oxidoreductase n=1 Tax=Amycolatopsis acidicola TaxID=2596893 RepID=A0A5N0UUZ3_9PSEU|nr:TIGR03619 family F420-dependent LLM class oxidoreductase [Amycolatopsis acidicola]KAA9156563.1 TIGR03619 family F420-dependent LLM class oxidoreductase [Amycolatopsis acidicola]